MVVVEKLILLEPKRRGACLEDAMNRFMILSNVRNSVVIAIKINYIAS